MKIIESYDKYEYKFGDTWKDFFKVGVEGGFWELIAFSFKCFFTMLVLYGLGLAFTKVLVSPEYLQSMCQIIK